MPDSDDRDDEEIDAADRPVDADTDADDAYDFIDEQAQQRLWLRTIVPLLGLRSHDQDPSGRVQLAFDLLHIEACERARRILRADLPGRPD